MLHTRMHACVCRLTWHERPPTCTPSTTTSVRPVSAGLGTQLSRWAGGWAAGCGCEWHWPCSAHSLRRLCCLPDLTPSQHLQASPNTEERPVPDVAPALLRLPSLSEQAVCPSRCRCTRWCTRLCSQKPLSRAHTSASMLRGECGWAGGSCGVSGGCETTVAGMDGRGFAALCCVRGRGVVLCTAACFHPGIVSACLSGSLPNCNQPAAPAARAPTHPSLPACLPLPLTCGSPVTYSLAAHSCIQSIPACLPTRRPSVPACRGAGAPHNSELARLGARTMLHMMIVDNLIHADLHPGNILGGWVRAVWVGRPGSTGGACWCVGLGTALLSRTNLNPSTRYQLPTITNSTS